MQMQWLLHATSLLFPFYSSPIRYSRLFRHLTLCKVWIIKCPLVTTRNKTATVVVYNKVHRFYQGAVYFQNVLRCHGTQVNVISLMSIQNVRPLLRRISRKSQMLNSVICILLVPNFSRIRKLMFKIQIEVNLCVKYKHCFDWAVF